MIGFDHNILQLALGGHTYLWKQISDLRIFTFDLFFVETGKLGFPDLDFSGHQLDSTLPLWNSP